MKTLLEKIKEVAESHILPDGDTVNVPTGLWLEDLVKRNPEGELDKKLTTLMFNCGYALGHHDTVESAYTDIHQDDMYTFHDEVVRELLESNRLSVPGKNDEQQYDEIMKQGERLYQQLIKQEDPYAFHKAFERARRLASGSTSVRRFWIAFQNTNNEQIYDREQKIIIWTKEERRINNITVNLHDRDWIPLKINA